MLKFIQIRVHSQSKHSLDIFPKKLSNLIHAIHI